MNYNVAATLEQHADKDPDRVAVKHYIKGQYHSLTFKELNDHSIKLAGSLQSLGAKVGDRVMVMVKPGLELIPIVFALFKVGAVPVVIDPGMGLKSFKTCVKRTKPVGLVGIGKAHILSLVFKEAFKTVQYRITVGKKLFWSGLKYKDIISSERFKYTEWSAKADDIAAILFTSGSTGAPKGVLYQHGQFHAQLNYLKDVFKLEPGGIDFPMLPVFTLFNPGLGISTVVPRINPSRPATLKPDIVVNTMLTEKVTQAFGSPVLWKKILNYCLKKNIKLESVLKVFIAGAPIPPELLKNLKSILPNAKIFTPYGATESLPISYIEAEEIIQETKELTEEGKGMCVGRAVPEVQIKVMKPVDGVIHSLKEITECETGVIGEIIVSGKIVTVGYDQLPEETEKAKITDQNGLWHRMGDMGYLDEKGRLWFCGRKSHRVLGLDKTCYSVCCEAIFNVHKAVERSALITVEKEGKVSAGLVIECSSEMTISRNELFEDLKKLKLKTEQTQTIEYFYFHDNFPVDVRHNAKINREVLGEWAKTQKAIQL